MGKATIQRTQHPGTGVGVCPLRELLKIQTRRRRFVLQINVASHLTGGEGSEEGHHPGGPGEKK